MGGGLIGTAQQATAAGFVRRVTALMKHAAVLKNLTRGAGPGPGQQPKEAS